MGLFDNNGDLIRFILMTLGVKDLDIKTSAPGTKFIITFTKYDQKHQIELTALEIIESILNKDNHETPPGFKDIKELPIQDGSQPDPGNRQSIRQTDQGKK